MFQAFPTVADFTVLDFEIWVLIFVRITTMMFLIPIIGASQVPAQVKVGLSVFLSIMVFAVLPDQEVAVPSDFPTLFVLAFKELYMGIVMGFAGGLLFLGLNIAGRLVDHNTGFAMIQSMNPLTQVNETVLGQMKVIFFTVILVVTGGHLFFFRVIAESFHTVPLMQIDMAVSSVSYIILKITSDAFEYGIKLAAPLIVPLLLATTGLAIVARIMPQINVWLVGMPLKIGVGLLSLVFVFPLLWSVFQKELSSVQFYQLALLKILGG